MAKVSEKSTVEKIEELALNLGYTATTEPSKIRGHRFKPDILVKHGRKFVVVEVKSRPPMLYDILQVSEYRKQGHAGSILCVPDDAFDRIPNSVRLYADQTGIHLCKLAQVGAKLKSMLD